MEGETQNIWQFGDFRLDTARKVLWHQEKTVSMPLKELELLSMLVRNRGELVTKDELLGEIWEDSFVEESNLSRHIYLLRKTLKELGAGGLIENVPRRGYRFTGDANFFDAAAVVMERRTRTRTTIEFQVPGNMSRGGRASLGRLLVVACVLVLTATGLAFYGFRYLGAASGAGSIKSLAVLPFKTIGDSDDTARSGAGLADILTTRLSNIRNVKIRPASAVQAVELSDALTAGKKLQVDAVLEGTIYRSGERVRVTARLLRVSDGTIIWAGEFEKLSRDEMHMQKELALQIVPALALNLTRGEHEALAKKYTDSPDAYDLYLKGRYEWNKRSTPGMIEAQRLFRNAIEADPEFALAYIGLADTLLTNQPAANEAQMLITKALELDPNMAEAHASRGFALMFYDWDWQGAEASFKKSLELNPNYATAHHWYATLLGIKGDIEAAKSEMRSALELNPISYNFLADLGQLYYFSGEYREAEQYCLRALEIYPDFSLAHEYLHYIYLITGEYDKAVAEITRADENNAFEHNTAKTYVALDKSASILRTRGIIGYLDLRFPDVPMGPEVFYLYAKKHAFVGDNHLALDLLEKSVEARSFLSPFVKADPLFERLRSEPRYQQILRKMGLA
jgi:DNA-binding winged helix-turn-helix (wHTH) protein/TolB-like protein